MRAFCAGWFREATWDQAVIYNTWGMSLPTIAVLSGCSDAVMGVVMPWLLLAPPVPRQKALVNVAVKS